MSVSVPEYVGAIMGAVPLPGLKIHSMHSLCPTPRFTRLLPGLLLALALQPAGAFQSVRDQEIAQCLPGEVATWGDGQDRPASSSPMVFVYDHAGAPAWFSEALVLSAVSKAAAAWSQCGVPSRVMSAVAGAPLPPGAVLVQWSEPFSGGNFGLANLTQRKLALGPAAFLMLKTRNPAHDASQTLQMVISHEMGHHFGLMAHSRRCVDVTSYYNNGKGEQCLTRDAVPRPAGLEYRALLPTACDIERCASVNKTRLPSPVGAARGY